MLASKHRCHVPLIRTVVLMLLQRYMLVSSLGEDMIDQRDWCGAFALIQPEITATPFAP